MLAGPLTEISKEGLACAKGFCQILEEEVAAGFLSKSLVLSRLGSTENMHPARFCQQRRRLAGNDRHTSRMHFYG
jgi:hypothetical protein